MALCAWGWKLTLATASLLRSLGADDDPTMMLADDIGLRLHIGPYLLQGGEFTSRWLRPTYRISGVIDTGRTISLVESEMPVELESEDEGLAWLAQILGRAIPDDVKPEWLLKGQDLKHLLL